MEGQYNAWIARNEMMQPKKEPISVSLTPDEAKKLDEIAEKHGYPNRSAFIAGVANEETQVRQLSGFQTIMLSVAALSIPELIDVMRRVIDLISEKTQETLSDDRQVSPGSRKDIRRTRLGLLDPLGSEHDHPSP
jgi:hypothetical protein